MSAKKPDSKFIYISPLKDCENENARQIAGLVENFMLESIALQIEFAECRTKQIYEYANNFIKKFNDE